MISVHVSGRLVRNPEQKISKNGKPYTQALIVSVTSDNELLVTLMVFDTDLQGLLASLKKGDSVSAMGSASIRAYADKEGKPQAGMSVMVNRLMALAEGKAKPKPKENESPRQFTEYQQPAGPREFAPDDDSDDSFEF